ncbi:hypoxia up-regulated protein 1-like isoform X1 [Clavelina lepadiformis]|uniref:hypoxia up-regulated protein 1-like isoform X1 n=1 Tax=Clavelina lepadiformis TaxID=159417 RepID=UPI0040436496
MQLFVGFLLLNTFLLYNSLCGGVAVMSIDLGSEWMKIAIVKPGVPMEIVLNKESKRKTEVGVSLRNDEREFGSAAVGKGVRFPKLVYLYLQDLLGKKLNHPLVKLFQKRFPYYDLKEDPETGTVTFVHDADKSINYTPEELVAMILNHSRSLAEEYAQQPIDTCVITIPAYFTQAERKAVLYAAKLAGLKVSQLMDDNTAAALNYGVFRRNDINASTTYIMFYDMGAFSTKASIIAYQVVKVNGIQDPQLSVKGMGFDRTLGGLEMELRLRDLLVKLFNENKKTSKDVTENPRAMAKLLKEARRLKKVLSANVDHFAQIEGLIDEEDFRVKVTREQFEETCSDLWDRVAQPMRDALKSADLTMDSISQILLVGGGTRVPKVQEILLKESGKTDLGKSINADEAAALGASYQAAAVSNAFKVKTFHVKSGAVYPIEVDFDRYTTEEDGSTSVKHVKRTLFQRNNPYPQRKVITFNRFYNNFNFSVNYGALKYLHEEDQSMFEDLNISHVELSGVAEAHEKYANNKDTEAKGIKAHFRMDESGILNLESVESVHEGNKTVEENVTEEADEDSTLQKIKDGISNFFGGGSDSANDTKPEDNADGSEKTETKSEGEEKKADKNSDDKKEAPKLDETPESSTKNVTKKLVKKSVKVKHSEPIGFFVTRFDHAVPASDHEKESLDKLKALADRDAFKLAREVALNKLESWIYDKRDRLFQTEYEEAMTEEESKVITAAINEASDWLDELEGEPAAEIYDEKRDALKKIARPWLARVKQRQDVVPLLQDMEGLFNYSLHFLSAVKMLPEDTQIYTPVEIETLTDLLNSTISWKNETMKEEEKLKPYDDPVLKPEDLRSKMIDLNREIQYLINKAKTAKPKTSEGKKKNETTTEADTTTVNGTTIEEPTTADEEKAADGTESPASEEESQEESPPTADTPDETQSRAEDSQQSTTEETITNENDKQEL